MRQITQKPAFINETTIFCDVCNEKITDYTSCICYKCEKDVCYKHRLWLEKPKSYSDDPDYENQCFCDSCANLYTSITEKIEQLKLGKEELDVQIDSLIKQRWNAINASL